MDRLLALMALVATALPAPASGQAGGGAPARLHALFDEAWQFELREDPLFATDVGDHRYDDRLPSVSREDEARRAQARRAFLARLGTIDRSGLSAEDRVSYDLFRRQLRDRIAEFEFGAYVLTLTADYGFHMAFADLPNRVPLARVGDYENYLARLRAFPAYLDQHIALMREGLARGFTVPRVTLRGYEATIAGHVVDDPTRSVFWRPFEALPAGVPAADRERLRAAGRAAIAGAVVPAYRRFLDFMTREYIPGARSTLGASALPNGRAYYEFLVRRYTTLETTPEEVHRIGLAEVARIRAEMDTVIRRTGFAGDFAAFLAFLRTDPRFYARTPEDLLREASWIAKRMDGKLPALFKILPRLPYGIEPVPPHIAPKFTGGRYIPAPVGSTRAGYYWVNTYALESRPLYTLEALTLHEAVPGHHLQIALAQELEDLPPFRRFGGVTAFTEGWALYAERLGLEAGFYTDPYRNFGRLTYEMWRACRLVVDTGIHALGWSREQAMDFLARHTALSLHEVETETDRYISWPGQALAYKTGELKIRELRREAEQALGPRFDLREFHEAVLRHGEVTLPVLEELVREWLRR
ncbi:MAG TPA: DUF885 domain-containing protein [Gemmatimonadales bacterium]|nr:DUF885 domain-containing protein [Gemmatimonadales bacterium]